IRGRLRDLLNVPRQIHDLVVLVSKDDRVSVCILYRVSKAKTTRTEGKFHDAGQDLDVGIALLTVGREGRRNLLKRAPSRIEVRKFVHDPALDHLSILYAPLMTLRVDSHQCASSVRIFSRYALKALPVKIPPLNGARLSAGLHIVPFGFKLRVVQVQICQELLESGV